MRDPPSPFLVCVFDPPCAMVIVTLACVCGNCCGCDVVIPTMVGGKYMGIVSPWLALQLIASSKTGVGSGVRGWVPWRVTM